MFQLLPCLLRLCLTADPLVCTRHQKHQSLLLQHVRQGIHLSESQIHVEFNSNVWIYLAVPSSKSAVLFPVLCQETYLMKHLAKHTVVEHVVSHHSPHHRTQSPSLPIHISLIWAQHPSRRFPVIFGCSSEGQWTHDWVPNMCQIVLVSREEGLSDEKILLTFLADQIVLSGTSKDDFSALSGLEETGLKFLFLCDRKKRYCSRQLHGKSF